MPQIISMSLCWKIKFLPHILGHSSARYLSMSLTLFRSSKASTCFLFAEPEPTNTHAEMMFHWTQMQSNLHEFVLTGLGLHKEQYLALTVYFSYSKFLNDLQSRLVSFPFYRNRKALVSKQIVGRARIRSHVFWTAEQWSICKVMQLSFND